MSAVTPAKGGGNIPSVCISGIFGTFLIALPLGVSIFGSYAPLIATVGVPLALAPHPRAVLGVPRKEHHRAGLERIVPPRDRDYPFACQHVVDLRSRV